MTACVLLVAQETWAQLPRTISYQGVLADAVGNLVPDAQHTLTFTLYDAASGGAVVFTETQSVPVVRGVFNAILGSATAGGIPPGVAFNRAYFLGIKVDGGAELVPRTALTASPYALRASIADALQMPYFTTVSTGGPLLDLTNAGNGSGVHVSSKVNFSVYGETPDTAVDATAGLFRNFSPTNQFETLRAISAGLATVLDVQQYNNAPAGNLATFAKNGSRVARIDWTGKGFFNGGTQTGGADVAEAFQTAEPVSAYEPGDVLVITTTRNRTVERSTVAHSTRVAGVYATKPGVLLTERAADADHEDTVPMGIIGVIPTKVSGENGPIERGDLLVTSTTPGHAMRAGAQPAAGSIIGKALEPFEGAGTGRINVLVSIR